MNNKINHPAHYTQGSIECIDAMKSAFGADKLKEYCKINAFKYIWRANHKNGIEDIRKAVWYLGKYIDLEVEEENEIIPKEEKPSIEAKMPAMHKRSINAIDRIYNRE